MAGMGLIDGMPVSDSTLPILLMILLPVLLLLVFCMFLVVLRISARLRRLEQVMLESLDVAEEVMPIKREPIKSEKSEFEEFLNEDGKRRMLTKREQSAAFREWRRQRGKTWNAGEKSEDG
jgi:biopolymer transport protein ExbB/TolQ